MRVIDLTDGSDLLGPRVGMFTRFPPSRSGSASASSELADRLTRRFGFRVEVIRLMQPGDQAAGGHPVIMDLNPRWHMSAKLASQSANRCDVALIQIDRHTPMASMEEFLEELSVPVILSVDDVALGGTDEARVLASLAGRVAAIVVPTDVARRRVEAESGQPVTVEVIPHGSSFQALEPRPEPRRQLVTWGFMEPGIGAERVVRSLAFLTDLDPPPRYRLIGVTDPGWNSRDISSYRSAISAAAHRLGVSDQVEIVPFLHSRAKLASEIEASDLIVLPYDATERAASRILTESVSTGRPVIATAFPGAIELLATGAGRSVAHDSDEEMADAIRLYLTDDGEYRRAARVALALSPSLSWEETARRYANLISSLAGSPELVNENSS
jgi:polysaccharide biosynthesis protein PslF